MPSQQNLFEVSGPAYLTSVNWSCPHDQRVVVASLVKATYIIEKDRVLAPAWWQHFHFDCKEVLRDVYDKSVYCCIYELKACFSQHPSAPRFIVTFRGTMLDRIRGLRDGFLDLLVTISGINKDPRLKIALEAVRRLISDYQETKKIWLAGHSLGASFATLTGKYIAKTDDIHLNTFLFNPPFPSISLDWFPNVNDKLKKGLRISKTIFKGGVSVLMQNQHKKSHEEFLKLAPWIPYLFVNPQDPISTSYIRYFEGRKNAEGTILGSIEQVASQTSLRGICGDVLGKGSEMPHLLPSARLAVNLKKCDLHEIHGIHQWWQKDVSLKFYDYHYQPNKC
ncbi:GDSL esterase/lipase [Carex littledalei]|uniref:GDSL esterase/lipase n=1 Tax=Carex littledalei TaxID=544730 RepID=A0A833R1U6_9POAL|nr:GDSL esterase/lipase [Carex littledalei]